MSGQLQVPYTKGLAILILRHNSVHRYAYHPHSTACECVVRVMSPKYGS